MKGQRQEKIEQGIVYRQRQSTGIRYGFQAVGAERAITAPKVNQLAKSLSNKGIDELTVEAVVAACRRLQSG